MLEEIAISGLQLRRMILQQTAQAISRSTSQTLANTNVAIEPYFNSFLLASVVLKNNKTGTDTTLTTVNCPSSTPILKANRVSRK
jgi:hypothetical protein